MIVDSSKPFTTHPSFTPLDQIAFGVGLFGFAMLITGIAFIYWPAAFIVAGLGMLFWSYITAKAVARGRCNQAPSAPAPVTSI